jgi:two-component system phosphate regulon sensor histidine kinase PhoR
MIYEMKQPKIEDESDETNFIPIGNLRFYYSLNELISGNERVIITSRQSEILQILASSLNKLVMREDILNRVWGDDSYSNSMALNVQITYLRRALKSDDRVIIEAIMKKGYLLRIQSLEENR